jgi:hypothetical protein
MTGDFVQVTDVPGTRYTIRTGESEVRIVQTEQVYYKIKDPFAKMHLKRHPGKDFFTMGSDPIVRNGEET